MPDCRISGELDVAYSSPGEFAKITRAWLTDGIRILAGEVSDEILAGPPLKPYWHEGVIDEEDPRFAIRVPPLWGDISILYPPRNKHYAKPYSKTSLKRLDALAPDLVDTFVELRKETQDGIFSCGLGVDRLGEDRGYARLHVGIDPGKDGDYSAECPEIAYMKSAAERWAPVFGHISQASYHPRGETQLEQALVLNVPQTLPHWDGYIRGYSWVTVVPAVLADRLGGNGRLRDSGVFADVEELPSGAVWLQATRRWSEYSENQNVVERVFEALAPVLPPGKPHTRNIIRPGAPGIPEISEPYLVSSRDAVEFHGKSLRPGSRSHGSFRVELRYAVPQ